MSCKHIHPTGQTSLEYGAFLDRMVKLGGRCWMCRMDALEAALLEIANGKHGASAAWIAGSALETNCNQATEGTRSVRPLDVGPTPRGILPNSLGTSTKGDANGV